MADNIRIKNIYYMLAYAYQTLSEAGFSTVESEDFDNIHELLAAILIKGVSSQIKRGLHRDYLLHSESLGNLRGKLDISNSIKQNTIKAKQMVCQFDEFSEDTQHNRILKLALMLLLRHGNVKLANKQSLRKLIMYFQNVSDISPNQINWNMVSYDRNNATYKMLINICWLVIKGLLLTTTDGQYRMSQFLDDQKMHRLYEKFVLGYYKKEHPQYAASASYIDWDLADDESKMLLPVMKTDITLTKGLRTLIIDTKYYGHTMQKNNMFNIAALISGNLYQIFTYVKNKDRLRTGCVSGVLLYAKTDEEITPNNDYTIGGNRIGVRTLDLGGEWSAIKGQLDDLLMYL